MGTAISHAPAPSHQAGTVRAADSLVATRVADKVTSSDRAANRIATRPSQLPPNDGDFKTKLRRDYAAGNFGAVAARVREEHAGGHPIPSRFRNPASAHFRSDLGSVRLHTDRFADLAATSLDANALTIGQDIYFAAGAYAPNRPDGLRRLVHELAHTVQQRGAGIARSSAVPRLEEQADALSSTRMPTLDRVGLAVLREPTQPRRSTGNTMIAEAERIIGITRDRDSENATTQLWSRVGSNFVGGITAGTIARRVWTYMFLRHFTEPESPPGTESAFPRYLYSKTYGWIDGQHFFGFIDYAEQQLATASGDREQAFRAATQQGIDIEARQQWVAEHLPAVPYAESNPMRLMQVRPPNTPLFRSPQMVAGALAGPGAKLLASRFASGTELELIDVLGPDQIQKFLTDSARSAWSYEDITSNQLGIRFFYQYGSQINALPPAAREQGFRDSLASFFGNIGVENDQSRLDVRARSLPSKERPPIEVPHTTEAHERERTPELFNLP